MVTVNVHEAKTNLSRLFAQVEGGEGVVIARNGKPVAQLVLVKKRGLSLIHISEPTRPY